MASSINEKLLNAQLPACVYKLCPNIPTELQQPNFDPIEYVNSQLKDKQFSTELLNSLISDVDARIKDIDREIEDIITQQDDVQLPDITETTQLFDDLKKIQTQVEQTQQNSAQFIEKMNRFNNARRQIDFLALNIEFCKQFQDICNQLPQQALPSDTQQQIDLISKYATCCCIYQYLTYLQDIPYLSQSFKYLNQFTTLIKQMKPPNYHQQDAFNFWTCYSVKFGFLLANNQHQQLLDEITRQIFTEGFNEIYNDSPITNYFVTKFEMFYKAHSKYLVDFAKVALQEVVKGRTVYYEYLNTYGYGETTYIHSDSNREIFIKDYEYLAQTYDFYEQFFQAVIKYLKVKLDSYLGKSYTGEVIQAMKLVERLEYLLTQDERTKVNPGYLSSLFQQKDSQIVTHITTQLEQYVNGTFLQAISVSIQQNQTAGKYARYLHNIYLFTEITIHFKKMLGMLDSVPKRIDLDQAKSLNQKYYELVTIQILPALEKRLLFQCYVTPAIEKQTRNFKNNYYAVFNDVFRGTVPPFLTLDTFTSAGLLLIDYSDTDGAVVTCCCDLLKTIKFINSFFNEIAKQLIVRLDTVYNQQEIVNLFEYSEPDGTYTAMFEAAICSVLIGQMIVSSFYQPLNYKEQRPRSQTITSAREVFLNYYYSLLGQIEGYYDDEDLDMLKTKLFNAFIQQLGSFIVGNCLKDQLQSEDYYNIKKSVEIIANEFQQSSDLSVSKIKQIINIKQMKADNSEVERAVFKTMLQQFPDANKWYDEVVVGFVVNK